MTTEQTATTFAELGVSDEIVAALSERGITEAFPIQTASIQAGLAGRDICGKAPTGSGKTLAFGIPAVDLCSMGTPWHPSVLILSPTRELATQIKDELEPLAKAKDRTILTVFGGTSIERDIKRLEKGIDILVACPGRLEDLIGRRCCDLRNVELVVVDEADRMADMGFLPAVKRLLDQTPSNRHTLLFSATLDGAVDMLIKRYQIDPLTFEVEEEIGDIGDVTHSWYLVQPVDRIPHAVAVLKRYESSIVFCRTRRGCDRVAKVFASHKLKAVAIHGDRSQHQRERALADFTSGKAQVLVATDVAARGIHVDNVALVMHYDPAGSDKDYIHRSGRTGRAGQDGHVISMVVEDKKKAARQLQKELGLKPGLEILEVESLGPVVKPPKAKPQPKPEHDDRFTATDSDGPDSGDGRGKHRNDRDTNRGGRNRDDRGGRNRDDRGGRDRDDRGGSDRDTNRGGRNRTAGRDSAGRGRGPSRGPDSGPRRDRDERSGPSRGAEGSSNRSSRTSDERRPDGKRQGFRRGANDWYPPGYDNDKRGGGRGGASRSESSGRSGDERKRDDEPKPPTVGGRNSTAKKDRDGKGRHADKSSTKDKGKRRNPRSS
jgi:superfamily II DNA/RNA helicase